MAKPTTYLRQVQRDECLVLQQWFQAEGWEHDETVKNGGYWEDVPVAPDTADPPPDLAV